MGFVVTGNLFAAMQVEPEFGRVFRPQENEVPGRDAVVVLSHAFWETQFAGDRNVLGRAVRLNGIDFTIVGALKEEFTGPDQWIQPDFYLPAMMWPRLSAGGQNPLDSRGLRGLNVKGRLKAGVTVEQAQAEAVVIAETLAREYPQTNRNYTIKVRTELQQRVAEGGIAAALVAMMMLLALAVLLVACANVAGLLTSRALARAREMSVRLAIGAARGRLIRQLLTESLILALLGGICGVGVAYAGVEFLKQMKEMTDVADVPVALSFRLDQRALLFSLAVALGSVLLFGLAPALRTARSNLTDALRTGGSPSISGRARLWTRHVLVVSQVALSMVLLTVATVLYLGFERELLAGPGFRADHVLLANFDPSVVNYSENQARNFYRDLEQRASRIPGVRSVALASAVPGSYDLESKTIVPEHYEVPEGQRSLSIMSSRVNENYFASLRIPMVRGRGFASADDADSAPVAIVNEVAAERYWPWQDPIGKRLRLGDGSGAWLEIVGVAKSGKYEYIVERPMPFLYVPDAQHPRARMTLLMESAGDPSALAAPFRESLRELDPAMPVYSIRTLQYTWDARAVDPSRLLNKMVAAMGCMGVLLALTGLYGLMAYSVSTRRREIGIRMAIGAHKNAVLGMVLRQGFVLAGTGTAVGLLLSAGVSRLLVAAFPAMRNSSITYLIVIPAVFGVTMLAAFLPARRASQVDPVTALRQD